MAGKMLMRVRQGWEHLIASEVSPDFLNVCEQNVRSIEDLVKGGNLLNQRQCQDLSSKLSKTFLHVRKLVERCRGTADHLRPALKNLYRCLEKGKALVTNCGEKKWWVAAVFQNQNQNAFQEILSEVGLAYNVIYEQVKSKSKDWNHDPPDDLRQPSVSPFVPAITGDVQDDQEVLQTRLKELASDPSGIKVQGYPLAEDAAVKAHSLARYLLKVQGALEQPLATTLDVRCSEIMWQKETEPAGTWGNSYYLGGGATAGGVCKTDWLGIPCARKEYHVKEHEVFFLKEAGILAHVKHPCIINFICCSNGEAKRDRFIAMELMEKSLSDLIEDQEDVHFPLPVVIDIIAQIARGMWYLHDRGVAHRDLKPQNVVVKRVASPDLEDLYYVKLVDFGTSKIEVDVSKSNTMTAVGIGTRMYRAPELHPSASTRHKGRAIWFKADAFSFAMTCVHVLSLKVPFKDMELILTSDGLYDALMNGRRPQLPKDCPPELVALLRDCWNTIPWKRPSFLEICTRLETLRHKSLRGCFTKNIELGSSLDFIESKMEEQSSLNKDSQRVHGDINDKVKDAKKKGDNVSTILCSSGCTLELLPQRPSTYKLLPYCDVCWEDIDEELYHCEACHFDAHPHCGEIKDKVKVSFHHHTLHLLIQNYYEDKPDAICYFCEESVQESEWVYRCEHCNVDVHAPCTKFPGELKRKSVHPHLFILRHYPPWESLLCTCCNGNINTWHYTCSVPSCGFNFHPLCATLLEKPLCIFNISHRISLRREQKIFHCGGCGTLGFSWFYHCYYCDVDVHLDCMDYMNDSKEDWNGAYDKFLMENGIQDSHTIMIMVSELLDMVPDNNIMIASSRSRPLPVMTRAQPAIQRLTLTETPNNLDALDKFDVNLQRQVATETDKRIKAKKMAAKEGRQKHLSRNLLEMLGNLEEKVVDLRSSENLSRDEVQMCTTTLEKLKSRQHLVKEQLATQLIVQSKMNQGPRIAVFFQESREEGKNWARKILTNLRADMQGVCFALLCEEPGHEHVVPRTARVWDVELGEELAEKLQPLLACGLQVVMTCLSTLQPHQLLESGLESVIVPCLGASTPWDLRAIEMYGSGSLDLSEVTERLETPKEAEYSAAKWFRNFQEDLGYNILKKHGLQRVRYNHAVGDEFWKHRQDNMAWLCSEHVNSGLKDGTLECYPLKYYNVDDDYQLRFPHLNPIL